MVMYVDEFLRKGKKQDLRIKLKGNKYTCFVTKITNRFASALTSQSETHK